MAGLYQGTQLDGLSAGNTIRVNSYFPYLTELYKIYYYSLSTFYYGRSINLAAANTKTIEIRFYLIFYLNVYQSLRTIIRLIRRPLQIPYISRYTIFSALN
jgi:hypothetical protein